MPWHGAGLLMALALSGAALPARAQQGAGPADTNAAQGLQDCAAIGPAPDRLACYDRLAGRAVEPVVPPAEAPLPYTPDAPPAATDGRAGTAARASQADAPASDSLLQAKGSPAVGGRGLQATRPSLLSAYWELDAEDKRGTFNFVNYKTNYALPIHYTTRINRRPSSPTQEAVQLPDYRNVEAKFQLSLRTKVLQAVGLPGADLWLTFTQQSLWQIYNSTDSKPFRNTDYEPEVVYVVPIPETMQPLIAGWHWRMVQAGLVHQSNGQSDPLSRSWNRVYLGTAIERGNWSLTGRLAHRISEDRTDDNNPDLIAYRGRMELQAVWSSGRHVASVLWRSTARDVKLGALQLDWSYPVFSDQPNGLRWYAQLFHGYGETLTDYNFRQTSLGLGISFLQF